MSHFYVKDDHGCFSSDSGITRGTEIFREKSTFAPESTLPQGVVTSNIFWIMNVMSSFESLSQTDQDDYLKIYNKYKGFSKYCRTTPEEKCKLKDCELFHDEDKVELKLLLERRMEERWHKIHG